MKTRALVGSVLLLGAASQAMAAPGDNAVGINVHLASDEELDAVVELGVKWVRIDANWDIVEQSQGQRNWAPIDRVIDSAHARGLQVFATVGYSPPWASTGDQRGDGATNDVPQAQPYRDFMAHAAQHLRGKGVRYIGIWNEPNLEQFFEGSVQQYLDIVARPGIAAIRENCADCVVLGPEMANVGELEDWMRPVLEAIGQDFDIISHHIYHRFEDPNASVFDAECGYWHGDCFHHALEQRRSAFTRPSLREMLDDAGLAHKELWMAETGFRGMAGDDGSLREQVEYLEKVLDYQLSRRWWTNTFFYEITDCLPFVPGCTIDGYGLIKAHHTNGPTWPENFDAKPAFDAVRNYVATHPELSEAPVTPNPSPDPDPTPSPDPEPEPPQRPALEAPKRAGITIDGDFADWIGNFTPIPIAQYVPTELADGSAQEIAVSFALGWDDASLLLAVRVEDDAHRNPGNDSALLWQGDSLQVALDALLDGATDGAEGYGANDFEVGFGFQAEAPAAHQWAGDPRLQLSYSLQSRGAGVDYEVAIPLEALGLNAAEGTRLGLTLLVNDDDGRGREGWIELTPGVGNFKGPEHFAAVTLGPAAQGPDPDPSPEPSADPDPDPSPEPDPSADPGPSPGPNPTPNTGAPVSSGGGGCNSAPQATSWGLPLLLLLLLRFRRRPRAR